MKPSGPASLEIELIVEQQGLFRSLPDARYGVCLLEPTGRSWYSRWNLSAPPARDERHERAREVRGEDRWPNWSRR
jgi:hypothetical protein